MKMKFYKCRHCGQIVAIIEPTGVDIICCGDPMDEMVANTTDAAVEKHVPEYKIENGKLHVSIGSVDHPMTPEHFIKWVYVETGHGSYLKELHPAEKPHVTFELAEGESPCCVYAYCNLHGLWKK